MLRFGEDELGEEMKMELRGKNIRIMWKEDLKDRIIIGKEI